MYVSSAYLEHVGSLLPFGQAHFTLVYLVVAWRQGSSDVGVGIYKRCVRHPMDGCLGNDGRLEGSKLSPSSRHVEDARSTPHSSSSSLQQ
jgi:hypothetical protein